jgi:hypothetical protein
VPGKISHWRKRDGERAATFTRQELLFAGVVAGQSWPLRTDFLRRIKFFWIIFSGHFRPEAVGDPDCGRKPLDQVREKSQ